MTKPYTSTFDGPTIITRENLCQILNLNTSRPALKFSAAEIRKAYKRRALEIHPDKQKNKKPSLPTKTCETLMTEMALARDFMLQNEDNIPGKAFVANSEKLLTANNNEWVDILISVLKAVQSGTSTIASAVPWVSHFSNNFFIILLLSTFSDGQLNFRYLNILSKELDTIRRYLKNIDGTPVANFLHQLKETLKSTDQIDADTILAQLKETLPEDLTKNKKFNELRAAIQDAGTELKNTLTTDFIEQLQHIINFWPHFITTAPSWKHIIGVYFISSLFTASSLPKYFNVTKTVTTVIWEQKSTMAFILSSLPIVVLTAALLPLNIAIQLGIQLTWIALKTSFQILSNSIKLLYSTMNTVRALFNEDISLSKNAFTLFENTLNLTIRLTFNLVIEVLDAVIFILSNQSMLSAFQCTFNSELDAMINSLRPQAKGPLARINANQDKTERSVPTEAPNPVFGFFDNGYASLHNVEDNWLKQILANYSIQDDEPNEAHSERMAM